MRAIFVFVITSWALATTLPDIALAWYPLSSYGFNQEGGRITSIRPGYPAAAAGIQVGDRIDLPAVAPGDRQHLYGAVYANSAQPGQPITLPIRRGNAVRVVTLKSKILDRTLADNVTNTILTLSQCAFVLIASVLVLLRPGVMTWAFFIYGLANTGLSTLLNANLPLPGFLAQFGIANFLSGAGPAAFAIFLLRFPQDRAAGWRRFVQLSLIPIGFVLGALDMYAGIGPTISGRDTSAFNAFVGVANYVIYALGACALFAAYGMAPSADRQRIKWVIAGLVAGFAGSVAFNVIRWLLPRWVSISLYNSMYSLNVLLPIALAYAVVKHRVISVNFVISRTIVYAGMTAAVIGIFATLDWFFSRYLSAAGVGTIVEIVAAITLGFWLSALHHRVNAFIDLVLFRRRHNAEQRLNRLARALPQVGSMDGIAQGLVDQPADALDLASAALFAREPSGFVRIRSVGWGDADVSRFDSGDLVVAQLAVDDQPARLHELGLPARGLPHSVAAPVLAVPVFVRRELRAFAVYGMHANGHDVDPDEIAVLGELALGASTALDHVEAERLREQAADHDRRLSALYPEQLVIRRAQLGEPLPSDDGEDDGDVVRRAQLGETLPGDDGEHDGDVARRAQLGETPKHWSFGPALSAVLACLLAALTLTMDVPDLARPWLPLGTAGVAIDNNDYVTVVDPRGPAARAGMAVGDRLDTSDFNTRIVWGWGTADLTSSPGKSVPVSFIHNGVRHTASLVTQPKVSSLADESLGFAGSIIGIFMVLTGLALTLLQPSVMTWGFYVYALALNPASSLKFAGALTPAGDVTLTAWELFLYAAGYVGLIAFALRFPTNTVSGFGRALQRIFAILFIPIAIAYAYYVVVFPLYGITGGVAFSGLTYAMAIVAYTIAMLAFWDTYAHGTRADRQKIKWVVAGFAIGVAGLIAGFVASDVSLSALSLPGWVAGSADFLAVMIPVTVAYAVVHHRVVDVRFAVSRAVQLGVLTAALITVFSLIDWFFSTELSASRLGTAADLVAALALGFWLNALHGKVDRLVDAVLFRQRHAAEERLLRVSRGLAHAATAQAIDEAVVREPIESLTLTSAAILVKDHSGAFVRRRDIGWPAGIARIVLPDDPLLLQLQGAARPLRIRDIGTAQAELPSGNARPTVAMPMLFRSQLIGVALYGPHASGAALDADELRSLEMLLRAAASAYDHVEAEALRARVERLSEALAAAGLRSSPAT